jgi:hypothetical protein
MRRTRPWIVTGIAAALFAAAGTAAAQSRAVRLNTAPNSSSTMGHPGHNLVTNTYACTVTAGPYAGAIMQGDTFLEVRGSEGWVLSANGTMRNMAGMAVFQHLEGQIKFAMADGKPTGWTMNGQSRYQGASGPMQPLNGRTIAWQAVSTGPETFTLEWNER